MRPSKRSPVNKRSSARQFRSHVGRTAQANVVTPMRGGWRL